MNALVELIGRIGIFMIAAQAVIHFTPEQKYEKYIKLLVGMIILLQFVMPLHDIMSGAETDWSMKLADMEKIFEMESADAEIAGSSSVTESVINSLENEIKSRLNNEISEEDYVVSNVRISMKASDGSGEVPAAARQYELEKVRVAVYRRIAPAESQTDENAGTAGMAVEKIQIEKIYAGGAADNGGQAFDGTRGGGIPYGEETEEAERLRELFCIVLGMDEEKMEVSVYGTNEKID